MNWLWFLLRIPMLPGRVRFQLRRALIIKGYAGELSAAVKERNFARLEELKGSQRFELDLVREEEAQHWTDIEIRKANRLYLSVPPLYNEDGSLSDMWEDGTQLGYRLSYKGMAALRERIRDELKGRRESWTAWASTLVGILGALTGLVSAMKG